MTIHNAKTSTPLVKQGYIFVALGVLGLSLTILFFMSRALDRRYAEQKENYFNFETKRLTGKINEHMSVYAQSLRSAAALYAASESITRQEWRTFVNMLQLDVNYPGLQGMGFAQAIPADQLNKHRKTIRQEGFPNYAIKPDYPRPFYTSIVYLEPFSGRNLRAFGYDMFSEPLRRKAMEWARDNADVSLSNKVTLVQEGNSEVQPGILSYFPIYRHGLAPPTREAREANLLGWVYSPYRMRDLMINILGDSLKQLRIEVFDGDKLNSDFLLYDSFNENSEGIHDALIQTRRFDFGGNFWTIRFTTLPDFATVNNLLPPWYENFALQIIALLLIYLTHAFLVARKNSYRAQELSESLKHSESRFRSLFEDSPVAYLAMDTNGHIKDVNPQLCHLMDYTSEQLVGKNLTDFMSQNETENFHLKLQTLFLYGILELELVLRRNSGTRVNIDLDGKLQKDNTGNGVVHCIISNITERKKAEERLQMSARVFSEAHEGISITDANGTIVDVNPTFCAITGYSHEEAIGKNHNLLKSGKHDVEFYKQLWQTLLTEGCWKGEIWNRKKNGDLFVELITISALRNEYGDIVNFVGLFSDITESKKQQQILENLAHHDPLTQLPNRTLFIDRFNQSIARCKRNSNLLAVVYMDLDGFKEVNDSYGHEAGDRLLIEVAERIKSILREEDTVARLGGDEFVLLLDHIESKQHCEQVLQRIHRIISEPYYLGINQINIGASSGVTLYPLDIDEPEALLRHADQAMYQAKHQGRNRFHFFDGQHNWGSLY